MPRQPTAFVVNCGLRSGAGIAVCSIDKYEFRTQARTFKPANTPRSDSMLQRFAYEMGKGMLKTSVASI